MKNLFSYLVIGLSLIVLAACSGTNNPPEQPGELAGSLNTPTVNAELHSGEVLPGRETVPDLPVVIDTSEFIDLNSAARMVPGEVIVKFKPDALRTQGLSELRVGAVTLTAAKALAIAGMQIYRASQVSEAETLALAKSLSARPDILYAEPNYLAYQARIPNDTFYSSQWHYPAIRLPEVWDITIGEPIAVGVVDSGIDYIPGRPDLSHPDFEGKILPGYDFVQDVRNSGDGDGRDILPYHEGNDHGTHVAGTVAAATDNDRGVAGVNWRAQIVPVRVLGVSGSGTYVDIMEGIYWAAGGRLPAVPENPNPAPVINVSIGGQSPCSAYMQEMFAEIFSLGATVVVSAGNENDDANRYAPASCPGVITVGATDAVNDRAPYSNYGPRIDVMAPGGDTSVDRTGDGRVDGVFSTGFNPQQGSVYTLKQGTSMAAPHVTGLISLMKGINPTLTTAEILTILRATAIPLTPASCRRDTGRDCGAGLVNGLAALQAVGQQGPPISAGSDVAFSPNPIEFGSSTSEVSLSFTNTTASPLNYQIVAINWLDTNPSAFPEGAFFADPLSGTIAVGASATISLGLDRSKLTADGNYAFDYIFKVNGQDTLVPGRFSQGFASDRPTGPTAVFSGLIDNNDELIKDNNGDVVLGGSVVYEAFKDNYSFEAKAGRHFVIAWVDENDNVELDEGDFLGFYPDYVSVSPSAKRDGVDFEVGLLLQLSAETNKSLIEQVRPLIKQLPK